MNGALGSDGSEKKSVEYGGAGTDGQVQRTSTCDPKPGTGGASGAAGAAGGNGKLYMSAESIVANPDIVVARPDCLEVSGYPAN